MLFCTFAVPNDVIMKKTTVYRRPMDENLFEEELTINKFFFR